MICGVLLPFKIFIAVAYKLYGKRQLWHENQGQAERFFHPVYLGRPLEIDFPSVR